MRFLLLIPIVAFAQAPPPTQWDVRQNGAPTSGCSSSQDVGKRYSRINAAATNATLYVCSNTGASTYAWALTGGTPDTSVYLTRATDQAGTDRYCRSTTGNDTYVCSVTPALTAYTRGMIVSLDPDTANTLTASININSLGAVQILTRDGSALATGDIVANRGASLYYNGTTFSLMGSSAVTCGVTAGTGVTIVACEVAIDTAVTQTRLGNQAGTSVYARSTTGNDTYIAALTPTLTAYTRGGCLTLDADTGNTLTATINVDALGVKSILNRTGAALATGDITANKPIQICYDGTQYIIQGDGGGASASPVTQWWCPMDNCTSTRSTVFTLAAANRTYFWRFYADRDRYVRRIGFPGTPIANTHVYGIYDAAGTTLLASCNSASTGVNPSGGFQVCDIGSQYTLVSGTEYMLVLATDGTTSATYCASPDIAYELNFLFGSQPSYYPSSRALFGYGANSASGSTTSMILPATMGAFTAANQCFPQIVFLPN